MEFHGRAVLHKKIQKEGYAKDISLKNFISKLSRIYADKVSGDWHCSKITKKRAEFAKAYNLDIPALIKDMNAIEALI